MSAFAPSNPHKFSWQQTMLRIKDPAVTVPFYVNNFGFQLIHKYDFPEWKFALYFLAILPEGETAPEPGTLEADRFLWNFSGVALELTHNYGSESDPDFRVNNGNVEPHRGFGHIAVMTPDVYAASAELESHGVRFQKKPDEGRMKGIAFALDPDGYWIELVSRSPESVVPPSQKYTLAQTMLRVKDPAVSVPFFVNHFGMTLLRVSHIGAGSPGGFSLYFLASLSAEEQEKWRSLVAAHPDQDVTLLPESAEFIRQIFSPVLELTHNHGTESDPNFAYHNGNDQDQGQLRGFGHIGYLCDDLEATCQALLDAGVKFKKLPHEGVMHNLAFAYSPVDNYWIEIIQRGAQMMKDA